MTGTAKCPDCGRQLPVSVLKCEECQANLKITWETDYPCRGEGFIEEVHNEREH